MITPRTLAYCLRHDIGPVHTTPDGATISGPKVADYVIVKVAGDMHTGLVAYDTTDGTVLMLPSPPKHPQTGTPLMAEDSTSYAMYLISKLTKLRKEQNGDNNNENA